MKFSRWNKLAGVFKRGAFRLRGYTPLPFLVLAILFANPTLPGILIGSALVILGEVVRVWAVCTAGVKTRSTSILAAQSLVTSGPYGYVRNPLYLSNLIIYLGIGLISMAFFPWLLAGAAVWFLIQYSLIVSYEEEFLSHSFGNEYDLYRRTVPRFVPTLQRFEPSGGQRAMLNAKSGLKSERRTLQAELVVVSVLVGIYLVRDLQG